MKRFTNLAGLASRERPPVGTTPSDVVFRENKWRLLRYRPAPDGPRHRTPVLLVPSLINRHYVLDLLPQKSFAGWLVAQGHDVYCVDWGTPGPEDRYLDFDTITDRYIGHALRVVTRRSGGRAPHLLGYCMGGTLAAIHVALHPTAVASLVALAAPVAFGGGGMLTAWARTKAFDVDALVDALGNVPWPLMQSAFNMLRPTLGLLKTVNLVDRAWNDHYLDGFLAIETWANDNVSLPGAFYRTWLGDLYRHDALMRSTLSVSGRRVQLDAITRPVLAISFLHDTIAPPAACEPLIAKVSSTDTQAVCVSGSHVGGMTSSKAASGLWPTLSGFWAARDGVLSAVSPTRAAGDA